MAPWQTSQLNSVEMGTKLNFLGSILRSILIMISAKRKLAVFHDTENMNLTDTVLKVSQWLI